jgi:NAD(P)-dependent dehydrogenase (short-subunit alcohol dehydrogenase family)
MERQHGITLNAVAPGPTRRFTHEEAVAALEHGPTGDENTPAHVAEIISWLCSEKASRVTGAVVPLPGHKPV